MPKFEVTLNLYTILRFAADILLYAVTLTFDPLILKVRSTSSVK